MLSESRLTWYVVGCLPVVDIVVVLGVVMPYSTNWGPVTPRLPPVSISAVVVVPENRVAVLSIGIEVHVAHVALAAKRLLSPLLTLTSLVFPVDYGPIAEGNMGRNITNEEPVVVRRTIAWSRCCRESERSVGAIFFSKG